MDLTVLFKEDKNSAFITQGRLLHTGKMLKDRTGVQFYVPQIEIMVEISANGHNHDRICT